jgi:hypothetical protein
MFKDESPDRENLSVDARKRAAVVRKSGSSDHEDESNNGT